jgi:hypothetical protein
MEVVRSTRRYVAYFLLLKIKIYQYVLLLLPPRTAQIFPNDGPYSCFGSTVGQSPLHVLLIRKSKLFLNSATSCKQRRTSCTWPNHIINLWASKKKPHIWEDLSMRLWVHNERIVLPPLVLFLWEMNRKGQSFLTSLHFLREKFKGIALESWALNVKVRSGSMMPWNLPLDARRCELLPCGAILPSKQDCSVLMSII